ncbi:MAG: SAM-dependent methyltransferase [Spartobacteria bacterium]|nr:SAM-dependent methyltransferase [Spartobacteria bacterium]
MSINKKRIKRYLETHDFGELFNQLGWDWPQSETPYPVQIGEALFKLEPVAHKRGFIAYHCACLPDSATRTKIESKLSRDVREHIVIFTDPETKKQRWQWVRRVPGQPLSRKEHEYLPNQPMLLIEKIGYLEVGMDEEENIDLLDVYDKVKTAFNIDNVTKKFYERFKKEHDAFLKFIKGINELGDAQWYASVMLNRLMFIYFIQKKGFLDGDYDYLRNRMALVQKKKGKDQFHTFYRCFLMILCHEVLAKQPKNRELDNDLLKLIGNVPYLNGGIFQPHEIERKYDEIDIADDAFEAIFDFFDQYEWHLDNRPAANTNEINPDVLGYIFEKYINQKQMGAYYTKEDITEYIAKNTIIPCLFDKAQKACKIAFEGEIAVWNLLRNDPDRYIYHAVRHGVTYDVHNDVERSEPVPYPEEIAIGLDTTKPDLLDRRKKWNTPAPPEAALPTEIWRETVARRQRYEEIKGKLQRGEIRCINDLITLNLDIRQFAQDVIERCESPDLLNAFWVAIAGRLPQNSNEAIKPGITVLDPTCGSGAFLFAALNILEPLYEACLERMKGFLEEWCAQPKHTNYTKFFRSILDEIDNHPSHKYFIYKSIIIHNLYGVDIMKEAIEICKLRLFLKLVAQVDEVNKIEPLPDIDFNIKAGNTLVGFATEEEMKSFFDQETGGQGLLQFDDRLEQVKDAAEEINRLYNLFREAQLEKDSSLTMAKKTLQNKLDALNDQLNQYLADDYGIDRKKKNAYASFLESHQPFHWFIEFYGIIKSGGFDAIIGNPPYVEYSKVRKEYQIKGYETEECGDLYAFVMERTLTLLAKNMFIGMIVPVSIVSTDGFSCLRDYMLHLASEAWSSSYAERPSKLFTGVEKRLTTWVQKKGENCTSLYLSKYHRWLTEERDLLFGLMEYTSANKAIIEDIIIPKIGNEIELMILQKIFLFTPLSVGLIGTSSHEVLYTRKLRYFVQFLDFVPRLTDSHGNNVLPSELKKLCFRDKGDDRTALALLNSNLFFWFFCAYSDVRNVNKREIVRFPIGFKKVTADVSLKLLELGSDLMSSYEENAQLITNNYKAHGKLTIQSFQPRLSKLIIDEIDKVLAEHYGFTKEELDYIINYDIKYRMGKELFEGE